MSENSMIGKAGAGMSRAPQRMNGLKIAREYFPGKEAGWILWNKTGWPCFFREGEKSLREQLAKYKRAVELKRDVCACCGKIRMQSQMRDEFCSLGLKRMGQ